MSLDDANNCCVQYHEVIIKTEPADDKFDDHLHPLKMKCEDEQNDSSRGCCDQTCELNNFENSYSHFPVKRDLEDLRVDVHKEPTEILELKEEINFEDNKPGWEQLGRSSTVGILKDELDPCVFVKENVMDRPFGSINEEVHAEDTEEYKYYQCAECSFETRHKSALTFHYKCKHSKEPQVYKCRECSFESIYKNALTRHRKRKHEGEVLKCQECPYETKNKSHFTQHKDNHTKVVDVYKCEECSFETRWKGNLSEHYKWKHAKYTQVYKCQECSFETRSKPNVTKHYKYIHAKEPKVYKCEECSYETKRKSHLTRHVKCKHGKEKKPNN